MITTGEWLLFSIGLGMAYVCCFLAGVLVNFGY